MLRFTGLAAILVVTMPTGVSAQVTGNEGLLLQCRDIKKKSDRLECFDNAMDSMFGVVEVVEAEREEMRRDNFGDLAAEKDEVAGEYTGTITHVDFNPTFQILRFQLDNGSVWEAKSGGSLRYGFFEPGQAIQIGRGALGTFRLSMPGKKGWRTVKRID